MFEFKFPMTKLMVAFAPDVEKQFSSQESKRAKTFDDDSLVCTLANPENCYDPDSLKKAFHPLGTFSKCFGLFPCYDFAFVENLNESKVRLIHILDYCYSAAIFLLLTGGAILCTIYKPGIIRPQPNTDPDHQGLDYYVKLGLIYATIFVGVQSLFIFPMKWNGVLNFVKLISSIDKILRFDGRMEERWFAKKVLFYLIGCLIFTLASFLTLFIYEGDNYKKALGEEGEACTTDYLMAPIMTLALMALVIPTGLAVFFLNAMRLRMEHFNRKMSVLLKPYIPSCGPCMSFTDYGKELDEYLKNVRMEEKAGKENNLAENLEKMRILHCEIRTLGNCFSCIFGMHLVRDFLYSLVALVLYTYFLIYFKHDGKHTWIIYGGQTVFIVLKIYVMVIFAQVICCQAMVLEGTLQRVSLRRLPEDSCFQVQIFMAAIANPPTISAAGFFHVNKALMTSILASITTYFIILIQFKLNSGLFSASAENSMGTTTTSL